MWSISYADDIAMMSTNKEGLQDMLKVLKRYLKKKKLDLNVKKTKIMSIGETRGRKNYKEK